MSSEQRIWFRIPTTRGGYGSWVPGSRGPGSPGPGPTFTPCRKDNQTIKFDQLIE